jgi:type IV secretory pathway VirJ component
MVLQGQMDQVCDPAEVGRFVGQVPAGRVVDLPKVGHGFGVPKNWGLQFDRAVESLLPAAGPWQLPPPPEPSHGPNRAPAEFRRRLEDLDLPLVATWPDSPKSILVFVSGDGGWMDLDRDLAERLHDQRVAVIGWNALHYFWEARSPEAYRRDLGRVLDALPVDLPVFAGGFSFGAEIDATTLAPAASRGAPPLSRLRGLVLLAPGPYATFEISPLDWIRTSTAPTGHPLAAALAGTGGLPVLCLQPSSDRDSGCGGKPHPGLTRKQLPGSHHFGGDYASLAREIVRFIAPAGAASPSRTHPRRSPSNAAHRG